ncbi:MAG: hypothetical protein GY711_25500 [bacterium]|nr:hypothetical protein [bacterium]
MSKVRTACAILLALPLLAFGGNHFLQWFMLPEIEGTAEGVEVLKSMRDSGLMNWIAASHVLIGLLLIVPRTRFFGALSQLPLALGIAAFHYTMLPEGLGPAIGMLLLNLLVLADPPGWSTLFGSEAS